MHSAHFCQTAEHWISIRLRTCKKSPSVPRAYCVSQCRVRLACASLRMAICRRCVAFHFLLIPIMLVPLCEHHKMEIGVLTGMVFAYFTSQRALVQYPLLAALVGTIGWLIGRKKEKEISETPEP